MKFKNIYWWFVVIVMCFKQIPRPIRNCTLLHQNFTAYKVRAV